MSERPGSNRRHSAWKADALPTELLSHGKESANINAFLILTMLFHQKLNYIFMMIIKEIEATETYHIRKKILRNRLDLLVEFVNLN